MRTPDIPGIEEETEIERPKSPCQIFIIGPIRYEYLNPKAQKVMKLDQEFLDELVKEGTLAHLRALLNQKKFWYRQDILWKRAMSTVHSWWIPKSKEQYSAITVQLAGTPCKELTEAALKILEGWNVCRIKLTPDGKVAGLQHFARIVLIEDMSWEKWPTDLVIRLLGKHECWIPGVKQEIAYRPEVVLFIAPEVIEDEWFTKYLLHPDIYQPLTDAVYMSIRYSRGYKRDFDYIVNHWVGRKTLQIIAEVLWIKWFNSRTFDELGVHSWTP